MYQIQPNSKQKHELFTTAINKLALCSFNDK